MIVILGSDSAGITVNRRKGEISRKQRKGEKGEEGRVRNGIENVFCFDRNSNEKKSESDNQTICLPSFLLLNVHHNKNCLALDSVF